MFPLWRSLKNLGGGIHQGALHTLKTPASCQLAPAPASVCCVMSLCPKDKPRFMTIDASVETRFMTIDEPEDPQKEPARVTSKSAVKSQTTMDLPL